MPKFSDKSISKLQTCHQDHQILFTHVIKYFDCTVVYGQRTPVLQFSLFKKGRKQINGIWVVVDKRKVVTNCDGYEKKSTHNTEPLSEGIDVVPYPTLYSDKATMRYFAGYVLGVADMLKSYGAIEHEIICGIDWDNDNDLNDQSLFDAGHFQIK